jgi:glycosyltransferase involved in cell wall biosynthesis
MQRAMAVEFTVAIVTRNRADALALSLPLFVADAAQPKTVLVVDSSDDPSANLRTVAAVSAATNIPIQHLIAPRGISVQRNIALDRVDTEVVIMPDDDSLIHPGAFRELMRIYEQDTAREVGGVCGLETLEAPAGTLSVANAVYRVRRFDQFKATVKPRLNRLERKWAPDPLKLAADAAYREMGPPPSWLAGLDARRVEWMTGFRMSFRTDVLRKLRFNENLGRYSLYEDVEASLGCLRMGLNLVGAHKARIYHHRSPENRADGQQMGMMLVLNRAYVICRTGFATPDMEAAMKRFGVFRIAQMAGLAVRDSYERDRMKGAIAALRMLPALFRASPHRLDETYLAIRAEAVGGA